MGTAAHYNYYVQNGVNNFGGTATDMTDGQLSDTSTTVPVSIKLYIDNLGSSTVYKNATWVAAAGGSGSNYAIG
jgi:hypothetical protein